MLLVHARVIRPYSYSLSDDERMYKLDRQREEEAKRDPPMTFPERFQSEGIATEEELASIREGVDAEVNAAADLALESSQPAPDTARLRVRTWKSIGGRGLR